MEDIIKKLEGKIEVYTDISNYKPEDQWMKGYIFGLKECVKDLETYKSLKENEISCKQ